MKIVASIEGRMNSSRFPGKMIENINGKSTLERVIEKVQKMKKVFFADPILDPIHYGFAESINRFIKIRKKFPKINLLMGTGNLTELTDCDSIGVNTVLMGLVSELSIKAVLVVQVSNHCSTSIKETDMARRLMF